MALLGPGEAPPRRIQQDHARLGRANRLHARGQRLGLATVLVSIPTLYSVFAVIAFGIGIILYGF